MDSQITPICDFVSGFMRCNLPEDAIDIDLQICAIRGIHMYKVDRDSHINKFRPWGSNISQYESLKRKMTNFLRHREATATPSCSYPQQQAQDVKGEEKACTIINTANSTCDNTWLHRCNSVQPVLQSHSDP